MVGSNENEFGRDVLIVAGATLILILAVTGLVYFQHERRILSATSAFRRTADGLPSIYRSAADAAKRHDVTGFNKSIGLLLESEIEMRDVANNMAPHQADDTLKHVALCINRLSSFNTSLNGPYALQMRQLDPQLPQQIDDCVSGKYL